MANEALELPLVCEGHTARLCALLTSDGGWDVRAELDDRVVASRRCCDWRGVERFRTWVESQLMDPAPPDTALRSDRASAA